MAQDTLVLDRNARGSRGLIYFWPMANGTSQRSFDLVQGSPLFRQNIVAASVTRGMEYTDDRVWMPYLSLVSDAHLQTDEFVPIDHIPVGPFSILIWIYPASTGDQRCIFFNNGSNPRFYFFANAGNLMLGMGDGVDTNMTNYTANKWQLASFAHDGTNWETAIDGLNEENASFTGVKTLGQTGFINALKLGESVGSANHWNSKFGPMAVYNRYLNPAEIRSIRNDYWCSYLSNQELSSIRDVVPKYFVIPRR